MIHDPLLYTVLAGLAVAIAPVLIAALVGAVADLIRGVAARVQATRARHRGARWHGPVEPLFVVLARRRWRRSIATARS